MTPALTICSCVCLLSVAFLIVAIGCFWMAQAWIIMKEDAQNGDPEGGDDGDDYISNERKRYKG